jgi:DNA-binding LacI/PurR family transcriptional regulator
MTVSRVFAHPGSVKESTRKRVLEIAGLMGYRKDLYASINAKKRGRHPADRTIVFNCRFELLLEASNFPFFSLVYFHFLRAIRSRGWRTVLTDVEVDPASFVNAGESDLMVLCGDVQANSLERVKRQARETPILSLCAGPIAPQSIDPDDEHGGRLAAEHLHRRGQRHAAVFYSPANRNHVDRFEAFTRRFRELSPDGKVDSIPMNLTRDRKLTDSIAEAALGRYFPKPGSLPDAVFAVNSYIAYHVWRFLSKRGVAIPRDVGFLGYDNPPFYQETEVPLSRIWFDPASIGMQAAARVAKLLEKPDLKPNHILLPVSLIDEKSVLSMKARREAP